MNRDGGVSGSCSCSRFPCARARHWRGTLGRAPAPGCVPLLPLLFYTFFGGWQGLPGTALAQRARLKREGLGRAWLRGRLCPGLDLLLGQSLPGWASGWEQGHAIRLSAELFIPGRRAAAGKGAGPDTGPFTQAVLSWPCRWDRARKGIPRTELLSASGCASGADGGKDEGGSADTAFSLFHPSGCSSPPLPGLERGGGALSR